MPVLTTDGPRRLIVLAMLACSMLPTAAAAKGPERWVAERDSRRASLPVGNHAAIESGELACEEFEWTLSLQLREAALPGEAKAELRVDGNAHPVKADIKDKAVTIAIARDLLEPLMAGQRLEIDFSGLLEDTLGDITVPLRGSRQAVRAVEAACAKRDMSAYEEVKFSADRKSIELVQELRAKDIRDFTYATTAKPKIEAASISLGEERRLVFTRLCGSWWYYGSSGCNITAFAEFPAEQKEGASEEQPQSSWREVYDSENAQVYLDRNSEFDGWPDIVSLPTRVDDEPKVWRWESGRYAFQRIFGAKEEPEAVEETTPETAEPAASDDKPVAEEAAQKPQQDATGETASTGKDEAAETEAQKTPDAEAVGAQPAKPTSDAEPAPASEAEEKPAEPSPSEDETSTTEAPAKPEPAEQPKPAGDEDPAPDAAESEATTPPSETAAGKPSDSSGTAKN